MSCPIPMPANPDAALINVCGRFEQLEAEYRRDCGIMADSDWWRGPDGYEEAITAIWETPATTAEGLMAKARAVWAYFDADQPEVDAIGDALWDVLRQAAGISE